MIYIFTDGYSDQFGGPEGKKFKYRRFRHLLLTIHKLSVLKQKDHLERSMEEWMGENDQVDDMRELAKQVWDDHVENQGFIVPEDEVVTDEESDKK